MKAVILAFCLVLGTLVAGAPIVEHRHVKPKITSISGDSFSDIVRFPSVNKSGSKLSDVPLSIARHQGNGTLNRTWPADPAYFDGRFLNGPVYPE